MSVGSEEGFFHSVVGFEGGEYESEYDRRDNTMHGEMLDRYVRILE